MKLVTRHTDYAVSALCYIAKRKEPVPAAELASSLDMPFAFIRGILQKLQTHKILHSSRGKTGGFTLAKNAEEISLYDIMDIFQDTFRTNGCVFKKHPCPRQKKCLLKHRLGRIQGVMKNEFQSVNIASLLH